MKRIALMACVVLGLALTAGQSHAGWCSQVCYSGYQPWWNIFAKRYKCITPEEERLQKFWHDYYDAMHNYYGALDHIDWVAYYKNHGVPIGACGPCGQSCGRVNYMPVVVAPNMIWAVPPAQNCAPPCPPPCMPGCMPGYGPQMAGPGMPGPGMPGPGGY